MLTVADLVVQERTKMKMMGYTKEKTKSDELINIFNSCDSLYKDCSECPLNSLIIFTENDEYISICHLLCFFREDIKDKIDKALS